MKVFETTRMIFVLSGFRPNETHLFNMNHLISMFAVISHVAFFFYEVDNVRGYVNSAYLITTTFGIFISFTHSIYKATTIFILISNVEKLVNKSECKWADIISSSRWSSCAWMATISAIQNSSISFAGLKYSRPREIYKKANEIVEKFSKIMKFVIINVTVSGLY